MKNYITTYGLPHDIKTDQGPGFQSGFSDFLKGHHIIHNYTSAYHPKSNGGSQRAVRSIEDVLRRDGRKITKEILAKVIFAINCHQEEKSGSRAERFFRRKPRTYPPNSIKKDLDYQDLVKQRHQKQVNLAKKKGRTSKDDFRVYDMVRIQCHVSKNWIKKGKIVEARKSDDGSEHSFVIETENGRRSIRHKTHLCHASSNKVEKKVSFELSNEHQENKSRPTTRSLAARANREGANRGGVQ